MQGAWVLTSLIFFAICFACQTLWPTRKYVLEDKKRQIHNLLLFVTNVIILKLFIPVSLVAIALFAQEHSYGLFNYLSLASCAEVILAIVLLDFAIYWQHVATHKIDFLWQMHKVHHADEEIDVTTAIRFHPLEMLLSLIYKVVVVLLLGVSVWSVVIFEALLFLGSTFNHSNWNISYRIDVILRTVIATPDVHRAHHSIYKEEQDSNYGFFLIFWDKLFNTYTRVPRDGHTQMKLGIRGYKYNRATFLSDMLLMPFRR